MYFYFWDEYNVQMFSCDGQMGTNLMSRVCVCVCTQI